MPKLAFQNATSLETKLTSTLSYWPRPALEADLGNVPPCLGSHHKNKKLFSQHSSQMSNGSKNVRSTRITCQSTLADQTDQILVMALLSRISSMSQWLLQNNQKRNLKEFHIILWIMYKTNILLKLSNLHYSSFKDFKLSEFQYRTYLST